MSPTQLPPPSDKIELTTARVVRVEEQVCEVYRHGQLTRVGYASIFPAPRTERVSPGHLVAIARAADGSQRVVWRWYDAVVLGRADDSSVRLWEPAHGEVVAEARASYAIQEPGTRAWASAGLPGAQWWVAARAGDGDPDVELCEVDALYADHDLWGAVFE